GQQFAGGAEKSLRTMGQALQNQGWQVEVFTTCNTHESQWSNTLPAGTLCEEGITVHRFPVDPYDAVRLGKAYQTINERRGTVTADVESQYLANSLGSQPLIRALQERKQEFQAILTGPYLFKLVYEVAQRFSDRVLLAPCFHEEPLARLTAFQRVYRQVAGMLFHSEAEARLAARELGIRPPRHAILGTVLPAIALQQASPRKLDSSEGEYLVYCGRYCPEKGLDRLVQYLDVVNQQRTPPIRLVCMGQGPY
ncbi:MAG TPA: glycosyltransferase, partial [Gemmatales bacterium]|nr:glycosyltransferase [Gemmatales bacterium]